PAYPRRSAEEGERDRLRDRRGPPDRHLTELVRGTTRADVGRLRGDANAKAPAVGVDVADLAAAREQVDGRLHERRVDAVARDLHRVRVEPEPGLAAERLEHGAPRAGERRDERPEIRAERVEPVDVRRHDPQADR